MFIIVETQDKQKRKKPGARRGKKFLILTTIHSHSSVNNRMMCSQNPTMSHASFLQTVKKRFPKSLKSLVIQRFPKLRWKGDKTRIFCIALQKTGTTSVGDFFTYFGYPTARYKHSRDNAWTRSWFDGNYEAIFDTEDFKQRQVFEDDPWWCLDFYKYLLRHKFNRCPGAIKLHKSH